MIRGVWAVLFFSATLCGCTITSPRRGAMAGHTYTGSSGGSHPGAAPAVSDDPQTALGQVDAHLKQSGYQRVGAPEHNPTFEEGALIAYPIEARADRCYTVVALARTGTDLNLFLIDPAGRTIGYHVQPDARPWTTVCPGVTGRVTARLQMVRGTSEYYYTVYEGPTTARPDLAALFGHAHAQVRRAQIDPATMQRLQAIDQRLQQERFHRVGEPRGEIVQTGQDRDFQLNLQQGGCYAFATLGGEGVVDTDLFLVDGSNNQLERDVEPNRDSVVQHCAEATGAYVLRARMYRGQGPLFVAVYARAEETSQDAGIIAETSTQGAGIDENFRLLDSDMRARGYEPRGGATRGELDEGETREFSLQLEGGKCYAILAVGDSGVRDLDLVLQDSSGRQLDRDVEADSRPVVRVCAQDSGQYSMQVRMYKGHGQFVYASYRWPRGTRGPFGLSGLMYVRLAEVTSLLAVEGYEPDVDAAPGKGVLRAQGQKRNHDVELQQGQCYSVLAVGGEGVNDLNLSLSAGRAQLSTDGTRTAFPSVRLCPERTGQYTLTVGAENGKGDYFYQVFRRGTNS